MNFSIPGLAITFLLLFTTQMNAQSIRGGVNEENFGTTSVSDFDFAGVWQGNRFEVVYDSLLNEVVRFEFVDSVMNLVFVRNTGEDQILYELMPLDNSDTLTFHRTLLLVDPDQESIDVMNSGNTDVPYQVFSKAVLYGADALQFNIDAPEHDSFFGHSYGPTEDMNIFWEIIRYYPD